MGKKLSFEERVDRQEKGKKGIIEARVDWKSVAGIALWARQKGEPFRNRSDLVSGSLDLLYNLLIRQGQLSPITSVQEAVEILDLCGIAPLTRGGTRLTNMVNAMSLDTMVSNASIGLPLPEGVSNEDFAKLTATAELFSKNLQCTPEDPELATIKKAKEEEEKRKIHEKIHAHCKHQSEPSLEDSLHSTRPSSNDPDTLYERSKEAELDEFDKMLLQQASLLNDPPEDEGESK